MRRKISTLAALLVAIAVSTATLAMTAAPANAITDRDCGDFGTQAAAQAFFAAAGPGDPHGLDADSNGVACESNPCPCTTGNPNPPQPTPTPPQPTPTPPPPSSDPVPTPPLPPLVRQKGNVVKVIDGDTIRVRLRGGGQATVRMLGIDTPETYGKRECGGRQASDNLARLAPVGSTVTLLSDRTQDLKDRYGRVLRYVMRKGTDLSKRQVHDGMSKVYVYDKPVARHALYKRAETVARKQHNGTWSTCW